MKANPPSLKNITHLILLDEIEAHLAKDCADRGIELLPLKNILAMKRTRPEPMLNPSHPLSYIFTSGTTGNPKGAIISQGNVASEIHSIADEVSFTTDDVHLSYLPLQHALERIWMFIVLAGGAHAHYYCGNMLELVKDIARVRPTVMPIVPRLLNKFYSMLNGFPYVDKKLAE